jgi:hypothetical protein
MMTTQWTGIVAALRPPLKSRSSGPTGFPEGLRPPDPLVKILDELVAAGSLVREVDPATGMTVYREPSK